MGRIDDYEARRKHLAGLTELELEARFWELAEKLVQPMIELAEKNTSPSIERSVLLRMGFSSLESKTIVDGAIDRGLMGKGVGNIIYRLSQSKNIGIRDAGLKLLNGDLWEDVIDLFKVGENNGA